MFPELADKTVSFYVHAEGRKGIRRRVYIHPDAWEGAIKTSTAFPLVYVEAGDSKKNGFKATVQRLGERLTTMIVGTSMQLQARGGSGASQNGDPMATHSVPPPDERGAGM